MTPEAQQIAIAKALLDDHFHALQPAPAPARADAETATPETDAFMTLIDDSEIDLGMVESKLGDMERQRDAALSESATLKQQLAEALSSESQWTPLRQRILEPANCGVAGHFRFQENGGHCSMCQRETVLASNACKELRPQLDDAVAANEQLRADAAMLETLKEAVTPRMKELAAQPHFHTTDADQRDLHQAYRKMVSVLTAATTTQTGMNP